MPLLKFSDTESLTLKHGVNQDFVRMVASGTIEEEIHKLILTNRRPPSSMGGGLTTDGLTSNLSRIDVTLCSKTRFTVH